MDRRRHPQAIAIARAMPRGGSLAPALLAGAAIAVLAHVPALGLALGLSAILKAVRG